MRIVTRKGRKKGEHGIKIIISSAGRHRRITVHDIELDELYDSILFFLKSKENLGDNIIIKEV